MQLLSNKQYEKQQPAPPQNRSHRSLRLGDDTCLLRRLRKRSPKNDVVASNSQLYNNVMRNAVWCWLLAMILVTCPQRCVHDLGVERGGDAAVVCTMPCPHGCDHHGKPLPQTPSPIDDENGDCDCRFCSCHGALPLPTNARSVVLNPLSMGIDGTNDRPKIRDNCREWQEILRPQSSRWRTGWGIRILRQSFQI